MPRRMSETKDFEADGVFLPEMNLEVVNEDDLCPICHLLLHKPVITKCNHSLCEFCLSTWADISLALQVVGLDVEEDDIQFAGGDTIEATCPLCRTLTTALPHESLELSLKTRYPLTYAEREREALSDDSQQGRISIESLTLMVGNSHNLIRSRTDDDENSSHNKHEWKFFVRPSRTDVVEEIHMHLHPTFRNPHIIVQHSPYQVRRLGWGYFTIYANVILKAGWQWVSAEAEDAPDGGERGSLPLEWMLDFNGAGSQRRCKVSIRREKEGQEHEDVAQREAVRRVEMQQRSQDADYTDERGDE